MENQPRAPTPYGSLGKLPKEIRLQIYEHLFSDRYGFSVPKAAKYKTQIADINMFMASSVLLTETRQLFYERGVFLIRLLSTDGYCYICRGVASVALLKKVKLDIGVGFLELKSGSAEEFKHSRRRLGESLAGAHDLDLFWTLPKWFRTMSLFTYIISFAEPLDWPPLCLWSLAYVYLGLGLCNMCINCDIVALGVKFKAPDSFGTWSTLVREGGCLIDRLRKRLQRFLGPGMVKNLSQESDRSLPAFQATLQYHPRRHDDRFLKEAWDENFRTFLVECTPDLWNCTLGLSDLLAISLSSQTYPPRDQIFLR